MYAIQAGPVEHRKSHSLIENVIVIRQQIKIILQPTAKPSAVPYFNDFGDGFVDFGSNALTELGQTGYTFIKSRSHQAIRVAHGWLVALFVLGGEHRFVSQISPELREHGCIEHFDHFAQQRVIVAIDGLLLSGSRL